MQRFLTTFLHFFALCGQISSYCLVARLRQFALRFLRSAHKGRKRQCFAEKAFTFYLYFPFFFQAAGRKYRSILKSGANVGGRRRVIKAGRKIRRLFLYGYGKDKLRRRFPFRFLRIRRAKGARLKYIVKNSCLNWQNIVK